MDILALKPGSEITISAMANGERIDFKSRVVEPYGETILIEEITNDNNEAISFVSDNVYLEMSSINSKNLPVIWKNVVVQHVRMGKNFYHRVIAGEDGKLYNRRNAFRMPIDRGAVIQIGTNTGTLDVLMHDVSTNGFSFITEKEVENIDGQQIHIMCTYNDFRMDIQGILARKQELAHNRFLYGVRVDKINPKLDKFIMDRQRIKASHVKKPLTAAADEKYEKLANMKAAVDKQSN